MSTWPDLWRYYKKVSCVVMGTLLSSGCGDPKLSRLESGSHATVYDEKEDRVFMESKAESSIDPVPVGTKVRVVDDAVEAGGEYRQVRVNVVEGQLSGKTGTITRHSLRPAK